MSLPIRLAFLLLPIAAFAADLPLAGLYGLETVTGGLARGKATGLLVEEPGAVNTSPALLSFLPEKAVSVEANFVYFAAGDLLVHAQAVFGSPTLAWTFGFKHLSSDAPAMSGSGENMGDINARLMEFQVGASARPFKKVPLALGLSAQLGTSHLMGYERFALGFHLGAILEAVPRSVLISLNVRNLGFDFRDLTQALGSFGGPRNDVVNVSNQYAAGLPVSVALGASFHPKPLPQLGVYAEISYTAPIGRDLLSGAQGPGDGRLEPRIGLEAALFKFATVSLGWVTRGDAAGVNGISAGVRLEIPPIDGTVFWVKYSLEPQFASTLNQYFGVGARFK